MGSVDKQVLRHFIETECQRRLFWELGQDDASWMTQVRAHEKKDTQRAQSSAHMDLGKSYEQQVYRAIMQEPSLTQAHTNHQGEVVATHINSATMSALTQRLAQMSSGYLFLLEHSWHVPELLWRELFGLSEAEPLPVTHPGQELRPDITLIERAVPGQEALRADGSLVEVVDGESRYSLRVIDVKHTSEHSVGKKHFIELVFYARALALWLAREGLDDRFYVRADGHGIFPMRDEHELRHISPVTLDRGLAITTRWRDCATLWTQLERVCRELYTARPSPIEEIPLKLQPSCSYCAFEADCQKTLKCGSQVPAEWDLRLLPTTSQTIFEQLRQLGYRTIGDVAQRLAQDPRAERGPLFIEAPLLSLKAKALVAGVPLPATEEHMGKGQRQFTLASPRFVDTRVYMDAEADPTHEVVFCVGLYMRSKPSTWGDDRGFVRHWWPFWRAVLDRVSPGASHHAQLRQEAAKVIDILGPSLAMRHGEKQEDVDGRREEFIEIAQDVALSLDTLRELGEVGFRQGDDGQLTFCYGFSEVCDGLGEDRELALALATLDQLYALLVVCDGMEQLLTTYKLKSIHPKYGADFEISSPTMAFFYWSQEQVGHLEALVERHLSTLTHGAQSRAQVQTLLEWIAPNESGVRHHEQHRKIFNLREVVESTTGQPHIINTTWHEIDERLRLERSQDKAKTQGQAIPTSVAPVSRTYWAPHFNHMDSAVWHRMDAERLMRSRMRMAVEIRQEVVKKLAALDKIWSSLLTQETNALRLSQKPVKTERLIEARADKMNPLARFWGMYAQLDGAVQSMQADQSRLDYPARGIGKLRVAQVTDLEIMEPTPEYEEGYVRFTLRDQSVNASFKEGDRALMVFESARHWTYVSDLSVEVMSSRFDEQLGGYRVEAAPTTGRQSSRIISKLKDHGFPHKDEPLYLYDSSSDVWSGRLYTNQFSLLKNHDNLMGESWLGHRLAYLLNVGVTQAKEAPDSLRFQAPELYMYAPKLLPCDEQDTQAALKTTAHPAPDPSQQAAISRALSQRVTCIQGPPGTGKSQTIAALIDEALLRAGERPFRVLVTAFSYDAMAVIADKLRRHTDDQGAPTQVAQTRLVFMRSVSRDPVMEDAPGLPHVFDLEIDAAKKMTLDGAAVKRGRKRLEELVLCGEGARKDQCVVFANVHICYQLTQSATNGKPFFFLPGFGFDLIIIDEASQVPTSYLLGSALLVKPHELTLKFDQGQPQDWKNASTQQLKAMSIVDPPPSDELTRLVVVGDQHQLPPVQSISPPLKLEPVLGSVFDYLLRAHELEPTQLRVNYRSHEDIVEYTRQLHLYEGLEAFRARHPHAPMPAVPPTLEPAWTRGLLDPGLAVHALIHDRTDELAISELEAKLTVELIMAHYAQCAPQDEAQERHFWEDQLGVVAPHNAQGRKTIERLRLALRGHTRLDPEALDRALRQTIYSVEKFQGSDRALIIGTIGVSASDQLRAEEEFLYGLNRFNVLTSRARQKVILICSQAFLDYIPQDRHVQVSAARIRSFASEFCTHSNAIEITNEHGAAEDIQWRWYQRGGAGAGQG